MYREDVGELYPVSKIEMEVKAQKDSIYGSTNFHDQYYAVSNSSDALPTVYFLSYVYTSIELLQGGVYVFSCFFSKL